MSEPIDVAVVCDRHLAGRIAKALRQASIHCSEFWPEDVIADSGGLPAPSPVVPGTVVAGAVGPFHVRVAPEDLSRARDVLLAAGLGEQVRSDAVAGDEAMREITRTGLQMHAVALLRFFCDRHVAAQIWPASSHRVLGLFETDQPPYRIMVPAEQLAAARELLSSPDAVGRRPRATPTRRPGL